MVQRLTGRGSSAAGASGGCGGGCSGDAYGGFVQRRPSPRPSNTPSCVLPATAAAQVPRVHRVARAPATLQCASPSEADPAAGVFEPDPGGTPMVGRVRQAEAQLEVAAWPETVASAPCTSALLACVAESLGGNGRPSTMTAAPEAASPRPSAAIRAAVPALHAPPASSASASGARCFTPRLSPRQRPAAPTPPTVRRIRACRSPPLCGGASPLGSAEAGLVQRKPRSPAKVDTSLPPPHPPQHVPPSPRQGAVPGSVPAAVPPLPPMPLASPRAQASPRASGRAEGGRGGGGGGARPSFTRPSWASVVELRDALANARRARRAKINEGAGRKCEP